MRTGSVSSITYVRERRRWAVKLNSLLILRLRVRVRALLEEFGDILGEGLLWLIHHKRDLSFPEASFWAEAMDSSFWHSVLQRREMLLTEITRRLLEHPADSCIADALVSVKEARARRYKLAAEDFVSFVHQWLRDLAQWRARLAGLPRVDSVAKALAELGLSHVAVTGDAEPQDCPTYSRTTPSPRNHDGVLPPDTPSSSICSCCRSRADRREDTGEPGWCLVRRPIRPEQEASGTF